MRHLALAVALACLLSGAARAGEMHSTGAAAPTAPGTVSANGEVPSTGTTAPGEMPSTGATVPGEMPGTGASEESSTLLTIILAFIGIVH